MKRVLIFALLLFAMLCLSYFFGGLKSYLKARVAIGRLNDVEMEVSKRKFFGTGKAGHTYRGMLGYVKRGSPIIIEIWGEYGPRFFLADDYTIYSSFIGCNEDVLNAKVGSNKVLIDRKITKSVDDWYKNLKKDEYVVVTIADSENGGNPGRLREITSYDWWYFLPETMGELCSR